MEYLNYAKHYYDMDLALPFFLVSLAGLVVVMGIIFVMARIAEEINKGKSDGHAAPYIERGYEDTGAYRGETEEENSPVYRNENTEQDLSFENGRGLYNYEYQVDDYDADSSHRSHKSKRPRSRGRNAVRKKRDMAHEKSFEFIESFYELVFASTSILLLLSLYYIIGDRINVNSVNEVWNNYKDWVLLLFLIISMLLNRILDKILVPIRRIDAKQRASMRLESSIYVVLILLYIRFIYESYNYESLIIYFVMLVVGRLFYFDVTWEGFKSDITGIFKNFPFLLLMGGYSAVVVWYGFKSGFLLKANGVLVSTLIAHLFMDVCIVLFDRLRVWKLFLH